MQSVDMQRKARPVPPRLQYSGEWSPLPQPCLSNTVEPVLVAWARGVALRVWAWESWPCPSTGQCSSGCKGGGWIRRDRRWVGLGYRKWNSSRILKKLKRKKKKSKSCQLTLAGLPVDANSWVCLISKGLMQNPKDSLSIFWHLLVWW